MHPLSTPTSGFYFSQFDLTSDPSPKDYIDSQPNPSSSKKGTRWSSLDKTIIELVRCYGEEWLAIRNQLLLNSKYFDILDNQQKVFDIKERFKELQKDFNSCLNSTQKEEIIKLGKQSVCISSISAQYLIKPDVITQIFTEDRLREIEKNSVKRKSIPSSLELQKPLENLKKKQRGDTEKEEIALEKPVSRLTVEPHQTISLLKTPFMEDHILEPQTFKKTFVKHYDLEKLDNEIIENVKKYGSRDWDTIIDQLSKKYDMSDILEFDLRKRLRQIVDSWKRTDLSDSEKNMIIQLKKDQFLNVDIAIKLRVCPQQIRKVFSSYNSKIKKEALRAKGLPIKQPQKPQHKIGPKQMQDKSSLAASAFKALQPVEGPCFLDLILQTDEPPLRADTEIEGIAFEKPVSGLGSEQRTMSLLEPQTVVGKLTLDNLHQIDDEILENVKKYGNKKWSLIHNLLSTKYNLSSIRQKDLKNRLKDIMKSWKPKKLSKDDLEKIIRQKNQNLETLQIAVDLKVSCRKVKNTYYHYKIKNSAKKQSKTRRLPAETLMIQEQRPQPLIPQQKISPKQMQETSSFTEFVLKDLQNEDSLDLSDLMFNTSDLPLPSLGSPVPLSNLETIGDSLDWDPIR